MRRASLAKTLRSLRPRAPRPAARPRPARAGRTADPITTEIILGGTGQLAALSVGIPQFMLSSTLPVRFAVEFFGEGGLFEGDVLVANDPYHGGGHLPDYNVFAPVFHDGECVLIASIQCHHADTGGGAPGGYKVNAPD